MIIFAAWIVAGSLCAFVTYGMSLGYWQGKFPALSGRDYEKDVGNALFEAAVAFALPVFGVLIFGSFYKFGIVYGLSFGRPKTSATQ